MNNRQFAEIFVQRNQDPPLPVGSRQNLFIAGVLRPVSSPYDIMPGRL